MNNNHHTTLFTVSPEDSVLRIKAGESDSAVLMGLFCLSGLGVGQSLDQASSYFVKAKQLGAKDTDEFIAYIHECNNHLAKAIDTYVGNDSSVRTGESYSSWISRRFKIVRSKRKQLQNLLKGYGLPECPLGTSLGNLLVELESGKRSLSDTCAIVSLTDDKEKWAYDTAHLLYEEGDLDLARLWLKKSRPDEEDGLAVLLSKDTYEESSDDFATVELTGSSLLDKRITIRILPQGLFVSEDSTKKALSEWSRECNSVKQSFIEEQRHNVEEDRRRKAEEERRKAEEEEEARKRAEERTFIVGRYGRQRDEILDKTVSRQHCRVTLLDDGMVEIENLSNSNGTVINGERIEKVKTSQDSNLKMGNYIIKVRDLFPPRKAPSGQDKITTA